jgi:hypothetical protein
MSCFADAILIELRKPEFRQLDHSILLNSAYSPAGFAWIMNYPADQEKTHHLAITLPLFAC